MISRGWLGRLLGLGHRTRGESEAELRFHVDERVDRLVASGWTRAAAEAEVARRFGDFDQALAALEHVERQRVRRGRVRAMWDATVRTVRTTTRMLRRDPGFSATVISTLALGIGGATAMFSVLNGALLRPLPLEDADRLVRVHNEFLETGGTGPFSIPNFIDLRDQQQALTGVAGYRVGSATLIEDASANRVRVLRVTSNFLDVIGIDPIEGAGFPEGAELATTERTVLVTHATWVGRFAGAPDLLGSELRVNGVPHTVVGILPESFWFAGGAQLVAPLEWDETVFGDDNRGSRRLSAVGRLNPGVTPEAAARDLTGITDRIAEAFPSNQVGWVVTVTPWRDFVLGSSRQAVWLLVGAVGLVLLIACVNAANLMLVRSERRVRDSAVRAAIGADRLSLVARHVGESLVLTSFSGVLGVALAVGLVDLLISVWGGDLPRAASIGVDAPALGAALAVTFATGVVVGLVPALRVDMRRLQSVLRSGGDGTRSGRRIQRVLVAGEVALAIVLVTGASLLSLSFQRLSSVETGIDPERSLVFDVSLPDTWQDGEERRRFFEDAVERIDRLGEVAAVGVSERPPLLGGYNITTLTSPDDPEIESSFVEVRRVTPDFFAASGIDLVAGRLFEPPEFGGGAGVVVISDQLRREIFPSGEWRGKRILRERNEVGYEVVGVVESVREFGVERDPRPSAYWPFGEVPVPAGLTFVVRTTHDDPLDVVPSIRAIIRELEPNAPLYGTRAMEDVVIETMGDRVFSTTLFTVFGVLAFGLAGVGVFSVLAYLVEQRHREIGIRLALGAGAGGVQRLVARETLVLGGVGLVVGLAVAWSSAWVIEEMLFDVAPRDPTVFAAVVLVAGLGAVAASWLPARRAARVDPMTAMREE